MKNSRTIFIGILSLLVSLCIFFALAEITTRLFYDESQNYQKDLWERVKKMSSSDNSSSSPSRLDKSIFYIDKEDALEKKIKDKQINESRYNFFFTDQGIGFYKTEDEYRVLVLGDSFTSGGGLFRPDATYNVYEDTYTTQLYNLLLSDGDFKALIGNKKIEVLPLTDGGLNTEQEFTLLRDLGIKYQPDIIILQYTDNDIGPKRVELGFTDTGMHIIPKANLLNVGGRPIPAIPYLSNEWNQFLLRYSAFMRFLSYKINISFVNINTDSISASFASLRKINLIAREAGVPFIIIELPPAAWTEDYCAYKSGYGGKALHEQLKSLSMEIGANFYNLCDYVKDIHSLKSELEPAEGSHYGRSGYGLVAEILREAIKKVISGK